MFETIAEVANPSVARVLITALKAHGFHPLEAGDSGLPGMPRMFSENVIAIEVPADEAGDARLLAEALLKEMIAR